MGKFNTCIWICSTLLVMKEKKIKIMRYYYTYFYFVQLFHVFLPPLLTVVLISLYQRMPWAKVSEILATERISSRGYKQRHKGCWEFTQALGEPETTGPRTVRSHRGLPSSDAVLCPYPALQYVLVKEESAMPSQRVSEQFTWDKTHNTCWSLGSPSSLLY